MFRKKLKYLVIVLIITLMLTSISYAKGGPPGYGGRWVGTDTHDTSEIYLTLAGPPKGPYKIHWTESYFSLCDSRHGRGSGTAVVTPEGISMDITFVCFHTDATVKVTGVVFTYDPSTNTLNYASGFYPEVDTFYRPSDYKK